MKYLIIIIAFLLVISTNVLGYLIITQNKPMTPIPSPSQSSNELITLKSQITKLQNELAELKNAVSRQSLLIQGLKEDYSAIPSETSESSSEKKQPVYSELFKDPDFAKELQERIDNIVKRAQQRQGAEMTKQFTKIGKQMFDDFVDEFGKNLELDAYQQQEFTKILSDRLNKSMALMFLQFGPQKLSSEEFKRREEVIRTESNEKIKQVLLPEQYEKYQKTESQFPGMGGGGWFRQMQPKQEQPQQPK